ncbi:MAG: hypothetical protein LBT84_05630 [Spirochaetia bacterium]|jgi:hypothetical protein|nr:hypothetical protein [Spirochaetia bacterium]
MRNYSNIILCSVLAAVLVSCGDGKNIRHSQKNLPRKAGIAIIVNASEKEREDIQNKFILAGFSVKAIGDLNQNKGAQPKNLHSDTFKIDTYNLEINKAAALHDIRNKLGANYLVIIKLQKRGMSWGRIIDLRTDELIWIENYAVQIGDDENSIINHFISAMGE